VLLDRRLGHHQVHGDLVRGGGQRERLVRQCRPAQRGEHVELAAGELGSGRAAQFGIRADGLLRQPADPAAGGAEAQHVAVVQDPAGDGPPVHPGPVA
jgi:hypothetical protein